LTYKESNSASTDNLLIIPCASRFGSYTAVDLARALDCEESVNILSNYGVDIQIITISGADNI
jgi:hypothetical protein